MTKKEILDKIRSLDFVPSQSEKPDYFFTPKEKIICKVKTGIGSETFNYLIELVDWNALDGFQISAKKIGWLKNEQIVDIQKLP